MSTESGRPAVYLCSTGRCPQLLQLLAGLLPELQRRHGQVGVFRPIVADPGDDQVLSAALEQIAARSGIEHWGTTANEILRNPTAALSQVIDRYAGCAANYAAMLVLGSEYDCSLAPVEFTWNTRISANIDVPMILVVPATGGAAETVQRAEVAIDEATRNHAQVLGVLATRSVDRQLTAADLAALPVPAYVVDEITDRASDLAAALNPLGGRVVAGAAELAGLRSSDLLIADMGLVNLLPLLRGDRTVLFSADRKSIPLGILIGAAAGRFPLPGAAIAAGPWQLSEDLVRLWQQLAPTVPLIRTEHTTEQVHLSLQGHGLAPSRLNTVQIHRARRLFAEQVDQDALLDASRIAGGDGVVTPLMFEHRLLTDARRADRHIVLPEGVEERILRAAHRLLGQGICRLTLLGRPAEIADRAAGLGLDISAAQLIEPAGSELRERFAAKYAELRAKKGITIEQARERMLDVSYFGTMMVYSGLADGMVSGSVNTTAHTIRPALEVIKTRPGVSVVSSVFLMCLPDRVLVFGDCAVNPNPTPEQVADIAISSALTARQFGIEPRVAMMSYSTGDSGSGPDVELTIEATRLVRERAPELAVDGPLQYDAAVEPSVARTKLPDSPVAGRATVLIFPDLQTGNNTYKAVQRSAGALAIGPVLQGLNKPVNDLSRGALVSDIVNTVAITAIQAGMD